MPNICCPFKNPCIDPASPISNLSAELPDANLFIGFNSFNAGDPPLGSLWSSTGCISQCTSTISQLDADICAANQQLICTTTDGGGPGGVDDGGGWINPVTGDHYDPRFNGDQTCNVKCPDGLLFSYTEPAGQILALSQGKADSVAFQVACEKAREHRVCLSALSQTEVCLGGKFSGTIVATGNTVDPIKTVWLNPGGNLPPGISMSFNIGGGTLTLSGTTIVAGSYTFTIAVLTPAGDSMSKTYTICVVDVANNSPLANGIVGVPYSQSLTATCGQLPENWQVVSGALPPGLFLNSETGLISGTPTAAGISSFTIKVQTSAT
jgi:hypothetical protein